MTLVPFPPTLCTPVRGGALEGFWRGVVLSPRPQRTLPRRPNSHGLPAGACRRGGGRSRFLLGRSAREPMAGAGQLERWLSEWGWALGVGAGLAAGSGACSNLGGHWSSFISVGKDPSPSRNRFRVMWMLSRCICPFPHLSCPSSAPKAG